MVSPPAASDGMPAASAAVFPARQLAVLGAGLILALPPAMWLANRSAPLLLGLAALALVAATLVADGFAPLLRRIRAGLSSPVGLALAAFLAWSLASLAWSHRPGAGLAAWGELALPLACGFAVALSGRLRPDLAFQRALALALTAAALLILLELATGLSQRVLLGLGKGVNRTDVFNRPVLTCLVLAAAVLPGLWMRSGAALADRALCLAAAVAIAVAVLASESGAAKLGLVIMVAVWALAQLAPRLMLALVAAGFAATMLLAPVVGEIADRAMPDALHKRLADSHSRARVDIWLSFGDAIQARPLIGSGFGASADLQNHTVASAVPPARRQMLAVGHPHSAPLQAWAETGAIGVGLLAFAGLACLLRLRQLPARELAPRLALFASAFGVASVGHGAWQGWWIAALALAVALFWLDRQGTAARNADEEPGHG